MNNDISGLARFTNKIENLEKCLSKNLDNKLLKSIGDAGVTIALSYYGGIEGISVNDEIVKDKVVIVAQDTREKPKIAYLEFGTGLVGSGTYQGILPTQTITFKNSDGIHSTNGWQYYYPSKFKVNDGWYFGKAFTKGQVAQGQMWETSQILRKELSNIARQTIREETK